MSSPLEDLRARLEAFFAAEAEREVTEEGELLFDLRTAQFRLEENRGRLLLHLWSPQRNWVRRVLAIAEETPARLVLEVERFGRAGPARLVIAPPRRSTLSERERATARRHFSAWLARLLAREFPRARVEGLTTAADLKRSFSGLYTRAVLTEANGRDSWAVLGVGESEDSTAVDGLLTYALIWLDWNRRRAPERVWAGLRLFVPAGRARTTANRLAVLAGHLRVELYEVDAEESTCARIDPGDFGNLETHLEHARVAEAVRARTRDTVARLRALAPEDVDAHVVGGREEVALRFRGLEFARVTPGGVSCGLGRRPAAPAPLTEKNLRGVAALLRSLQRERAPGGPARSRWYRAQPERWLESLAAGSPQKIDPRLAPERVLRQVPAVSAGERGVADLLGATRDGQLLVIELKASTDVHLPLQALDYWLRVRWHQQRSSFARAGYFAGLALRPEPPELLLVAPALQFHPTTEALATYLAPAVPVTLVGINEDWRREIQVVWRRRLGAGM
ncbi:MAG TPA: hypothetical protein VNN18_12815 [Candidatus Xenobia bacterium]|nr:hypothetical protein [Candidatus Xenobia bacterium]